MELEKQVQELRDYQKRLHAYAHVANLLTYDANTSMPGGGSDATGDTMELIAGEIHSMSVDPRIGQLLSDLYARRDELDFQTRREVEELREQREKQEKVPKEAVMAAEKAANAGRHYWQLAKAQSDFSIFKPYLANMVEIRRQYANYIRPGADVYDTLLNEFEKGCTQTMLDPFFDLMGEKLTPVLHAIIQKGVQPEMGFLNNTFPIPQQKELSGYLMDVMGIDKSHCVLRESEHPFTVEFSRDDVRITTKYFEDDLLSNLFSVVHESGHAMYELSVAPELLHSCMGHGATTAIHESQSRLWENYIARSHAFCDLIFPEVCRLFPEQMASVTPEMFYRAVNVARPSLIRTDADELTYPFHVLVRYELEKALFCNELTVDDLPAAWNELYKKYLGVDVPDDAHGVLQDMHWADGTFGYFPSYALGTAYSAQFMAALERELDVNACIARGDLSPVKQWLTEKIYRHGMLLTADELLRRATGESFAPHYYVDYLTEKYTGLYGVSV